MFTEAIGGSEPFLDFSARLSRAAKVDRPVLIVGERGVGKELAASRLHFLSKRWGSPFLTLNCSALASSLLESELFGHEAGAFTGAASRRKGWFEAADSGALFLDEISNMPMALQEKILRVIEYGRFERIGSSRSIQVDVRIVAASNQDLPSMAAKGEFKTDLLDRLSFEVLTLPPLRARGDDIPVLARYFATRMALELGRPSPPEFGKNAMSVLLSYPWPGNIRELKNVIERAVYLNEPGKITDIVLDPFDSPYRPAPESPPEVADKPDSPIDPPPASLAQAMADHEIKLISRALISSRFNQKLAADMLGLSYDQFRNRYRKHRAEIDRLAVP